MASKDGSGAGGTSASSSSTDMFYSLDEIKNEGMGGELIYNDDIDSISLNAMIADPETSDNDKEVMDWVIEQRMNILREYMEDKVDEQDLMSNDFQSIIKSQSSAFLTDDELSELWNQVDEAYRNLNIDDFSTEEYNAILNTRGEISSERSRRVPRTRR